MRGVGEKATLTGDAVVDALERMVHRFDKGAISDGRSAKGMRSSSEFNLCLPRARRSAQRREAAPHDEESDEGQNAA